MRIASLVLGGLLLGVPTVSSASGPAELQPELHQEALLDGIRLGVRLTPLDGGAGLVGSPPAAGGLREGQLLRFQLELSDTATGSPLTGANPAAWMDRLPPREATTAQSCIDKVETFLGGSILAQAELDLNVYYVVTMNDDASLSVVDPLFGFGGTRLLAMVRLWSSGRDWVVSADQRRIFVSMPESGAVAVVETHDWQVSTNLRTAPSPGRLAMQHDGAYLWAAYDEARATEEISGVQPLLPGSLAVLDPIATGRGPHDLALSDDDRFVFITNEGDGTVSVVDVRRREVVTTIATGPRPGSVTWSEVAGAAYVSHRGDGSVVAIRRQQTDSGDGAEGRWLTARMTSPRKTSPRKTAESPGSGLGPGLGEIRAAPGGRFVLAVNPEADLLHVIDASRNAVVQTGPMAESPDQIAFTESLAYVRHRDSEVVLMVPLSELGRAGESIPVIDFPGGQKAPGDALFRRGPSLAPAIVRAPGLHAVLVANAADGMVYFYSEGMAAPMGSFQSYGPAADAVMVIDNSLRERRPGVYETTARLRRPGAYELAVYLDSPRSIHCFPLHVEADPEMEARRRELPPSVRATVGDRLEVAAGETRELTFEITDPRSGAPIELDDLRVFSLLAPGRWHRRDAARALGDGRYTATLRFPREGVYYVYAESPDGGLSVAARPVLYVVAHGVAQGADAGEEPGR